MAEPVPIPGYEAVPIPFPTPGSWIEEGQSLDLGEFRQGYCLGHLYKTADNQLHVFLEVATWKGVCVKADMPLSVPAASGDVSILHIRWRDRGVRLQQDAGPAIDANWQPLP